MRRYFYLMMAMVLAFSLAIPLNSMAQTPLKLRLMTETGDMITTNDPIIKNFFMSSDGVLAAILDSSLGGLNFTFATDETHIGIKNGQNCTISNYVVTATAGNTLSFEVYSDTSGATITAPALPGGNFNSGTYQWATITGDVGTYLAVFQATSSKKTSQIVVMIKIVSSTQYTLTVNISPSSAAGSVSLDPSGGTYAANTVVTLTASANANYTFSSWSEGLSPLGTSNPIQITMNSARTITANFTSGGGGTYSSQVASAVKLDQPTVGNPYAYGYYSGPGSGGGSYTIPLGATVWFLVDPKGFTGKSVSDIAIQFTDFAQGGNLEVWIYTIDSSDNLHSGLVFNPVKIPLSTNTYGPWSPRGGHDDSKRYLIKVVECGSYAVPYNIYWWF